MSFGSFIYGAATLINSLFSSPDQNVMKVMESKYTDRNIYKTEVAAPMADSIENSCNFYKMTDDMGHMGVVVELDYKPDDAIHDGQIYTESFDALKEQLGIRKGNHLRGLRSSIIEDVDEGDGKHTAKVLYFFKDGSPYCSKYDRDALEGLAEGLASVPGI